MVSRKYSNESAIEALKIPRKYEVPFAVNNIIGFPGETRELAMDTVEINRAFDPDQMSCSILQPYHGTQLHQVCVERGYLNPDTLCPANSETTVMNMPDFSPDGLRGLKRTFAMYVKFPKSRWKDIEIAEQLTPQGDSMWEKLSVEYTDQFLSSPAPDITEQGNPIPVTG